MSFWNRWSTALYLFVVVLLVALFLGAATMHVNAQEATPDASPPPIVVVASPEQTITDINTIVIGFILAFVAGGATVGASFMLFAKRIREQPELARAIERLYLSVPADKQRVVRNVIVAGKEGFDLAEDLTDGDMQTPTPQRE